MCPCYARKLVRRALIIVGKAPIAGSAKTRLVPTLSTDAAADLYRAFLLDTLALSRSLEWERVAIIHPRGHGPALRSFAESVELVEQPAEGLGNALSYAFEHHFELGFDRVVLIGSDSPTLTVEPILAAERAEDVALGPTRDGGYYLIGMRRPHLGLFKDIEWSTRHVFAQTIERADELELPVEVVHEWYDVDEAADLDLLVNDLRTQPPRLAAHTRAVLHRYQDAWGRSGAPGVGIGDARGNFSGSPAPRQDYD